MRTAIITALLVILSSLLLAACVKQETKAVSPSPPTTTNGAQPIQLTGTLRSGIASIGGEHTGWVVRRPGGEVIETDVSAVYDQARRLDGMVVVATGRIIEKKYVERGPTRILVAESIVREGVDTDPSR